MIVVRVFIETDKREEQLAEVRIKNQRQFADGELADYTVEYAVERGAAVGLHRRTIEGYPRRIYNVLALVRQALATLEPKELRLEDDFDPDEAPVPTDLARRLRRSLRSLPRGER